MALTKYNYNSFDVTPVASKALGFNSGANGLTSISPTSMVLIKTITASTGDATISFVDGTSDVVLDNTYPVYLFKFINLHTANDDVHLKVNFSADTGSNYNVTKTSTYFKTYHGEDGTSGALSYDGGHDIAQGTGSMSLRNDAGNANDESSSGELWLFNPSSTTYVKHFIYRLTCNQRNYAASENFGAGYCNTTSAVDAVQFSVSGGSYGSGTFKLYGIKDS